MYCKETHTHFKKVSFGYQIDYIDTFVYEIDDPIPEKTEWYSELHQCKFELFTTEEEAMKGVADD